MKQTRPKTSRRKRLLYGRNHLKIKGTVKLRRMKLWELLLDRSEERHVTLSRFSAGHVSAEERCKRLRCCGISGKENNEVYAIRAQPEVGADKNFIDAGSVIHAGPRSEYADFSFVRGAFDLGSLPPYHEHERPDGRHRSSHLVSQPARHQPNEIDWRQLTVKRGVVT